MPSLSPFIILVMIVVLLCTGTYVQYVISPLTAVTEKKRFSLEPVIPSTKQLDDSLLPPLKHDIPEACKQVNFQWLASDRSFWDGWSSKSMFMKKDGKFTRKNVHILEGESICITVLLGPIPAVSSIKSMSHYAPSDSIVMTAKSREGAKLLPITLQQHDQQTNAYFASVQFSRHDIYTLETSVEYRSYFWELPNFHKYLPNKFTSRNSLTVSKKNETQQLQQNQCNNTLELKDSLWMNKQHYQQVDPIGFYNSQFNSMDSDLIFIPQCELKPISACFSSEKTIHVWGDRYLKRNIQYLNGDILPTDLCNEIHQDYQVDTPIEIAEGKVGIHFGDVDSQIGFDYRNELKANIQKIAHRLPTADIVLLGIGNYDLSSARQTPNEFATAFHSLLNYLIQHVYTRNEKIIVKTTQYYGSHYPNGGWTHGRSEAYANIIRSSVNSLTKKDKSRVMLWDTYQVGLNENSICQDKSMSNSNVIKVENTLLSNLIYSITTKQGNPI